MLIRPEVSHLSPIARRLLPLLLLVLAGSAPAAAQNLSQYLDRTIERVEIDLVGAAEDGSARQLIEQFVRAGEPLSADDVRRTIERLTESGLAANVVVEVAEGAPGGGVVLRYRITPTVRVAAIRISGENVAEAEALRGRLTAIGPGVRLTEPVLERGAEEIARYYEERGFFDVRVRREVELDETGTRATVEYSVEPGEQARVGTFTIVGGLGLPRERLVEVTELGPGDPFTRNALDTDIENIRQTLLGAGYLSPEIGEPEIERNPIANTVTIRLPIEAGEVVDVDVEGIELSEEERRELLPILGEGGLDEYQLSEGVRRLTERLQREGYFFPRVRYEVERVEETPRRIVYTVEPGRRFKVSDIDIVGTDAISYEELAPVLQSQEGGFFSRGLTSQDLLERDARTIERRLRAIGYRRAVVRERRLGVSPDSDDLVITFVVEEGPRTSVASVGLRGNTIFTRDDLLGADDRALEEGEFYDEAQIAEDAAEILKQYGDRGYISAEVNPRVIELDEDLVRVIYDITEGPKAIIADIRIVGNRLTTDETLRNYFEFEVGEVLELEDLRRTEQVLFEAGAFRQVVITSEVTGIGPDGLTELRTIFITVEEASPWVLVYGGGYNTDEGPRGIFEISNLNLFGRLNTGTLRIRGSAREQLAQLTYTNPNPFGYDYPLLLSAFYKREEKEAFGVQRFTALAQVQKKIDLQTVVFFRYLFERVRIFDAMLSERELERSDRPVRLGRVSFTYIRDTRDNPFDPVDGQLISADLSVAAEVLGGNEAYVKFYSEYQRFDPVPVFDNVIYAGAVKLGIAEPFGDRRRLPISERFFAGGAGTLRGFGFEEAGPRDPVTNEPVGGNVLFVANNELRFPLFWRFGGAVFTDVGNVFRRVSDFNIQEFTVTVGAGLRLDTPVGPVRVDFGYLLNPPEFARGYAVHLRFGQSF